MTAIVLAGGKSSRFGSDKASTLLFGRPLLQWVVDAAARAADEVVVVAAVGQEVPGITCGVPAKLVRDVYAERGPLAGLVTGFEHASHDACLALACDAALLAPDLLRELAALLADADAVVPSVEGRLQPLVAAYLRSACLESFRTRLEAGQLALTAAAEAVGPLVIEEHVLRRFDSDLHSFLNANTADAFAAVRSAVESNLRNPKPEMT